MVDYLKSIYRPNGEALEYVPYGPYLYGRCSHGGPVHLSFDPIQILTKGGLSAIKDFDFYGPDDRFGVTLGFINPEDTELLLKRYGKDYRIMAGMWMVI